MKKELGRSDMEEVRFMEAEHSLHRLRIDSRGYHSGKGKLRVFKLTEMYYVIVISRQVIREILGVLHRPCK